MRDEGCRMRDEGCRMNDEECRMQVAGRGILVMPVEVGLFGKFPRYLSLLISCMVRQLSFFNA
jgi:hypothetical protein